MSSVLRPESIFIYQTGVCTRMFENKTVLLIGASGGIGGAVAKKISHLGGTLILVARNRNKLELAAKSLQNVEVMPGDATNLQQMQSIVKNIENKYGKIDIVIHAVGNILLRPLHTISEEQFRNSLEVNLMSAFCVLKSVIRGMMKRKSGSIVVISSVAAQKGMRNHEAISASKAALEGLVRSAAITYASRGIRFNGVALGLIDTNLAKENKLTTTENARKIANEMHPLGRYGQVEDVVDQILFLASDRSSWMTGVFIPIDGGLSAN